MGGRRGVPAAPLEKNLTGCWEHHVHWWVCASGLTLPGSASICQFPKLDVRNLKNQKLDRQVKNPSRGELVPPEARRAHPLRRKRSPRAPRRPPGPASPDSSWPPPRSGRLPRRAPATKTAGCWTHTQGMTGDHLLGISHSKLHHFGSCPNRTMLFLACFGSFFQAAGSQDAI